MASLTSGEEPIDLCACFNGYTVQCHVGPFQIEQLQAIQGGCPTHLLSCLHALLHSTGVHVVKASVHEMQTPEELEIISKLMQLVVPVVPLPQAQFVV